MKTKHTFAALGLLLLGTLHSPAAIIVPGAGGSDGALNITTDTEIDLSQAITGIWDANNAANAGKGIYDASKWAVVFKYSSVSIAAGKTLTFKNNASHAPVVWLVNGNVDIAGTVSVDGKIYAIAPALAEPGPGGFRGGTGTFTTGLNASAGFGPGGGTRRQGNVGYGGVYGLAVDEIVPYGNPSLIPLIGGSGGSGDPEFREYNPGGGGGGGAILIASTGTISVTGAIRANGGQGFDGGFGTNTGGGSGGGIRLVCDQLTGGGAIQAIGGTGWSAGSFGRIRIERVNNSNSSTPAPDASIIPLAPNATALLWPPTDAPDVKIVSIGGQTIGNDPKASFGTFGADAALPQTTSTQAIIETTNVEQASSVKVRLTPRANANFTEVAATVSNVVSTTPLVVRWTAALPVNTGYSAVQVKVVRP